MKNRLKIFLLIAIGAFVFTNCQKDPKLRIPDLQMGVIPKLVKDATKDQTINFFNQAAFKGSFTVDTYYSDQPTSIEIWVTWKGDKTKKALVQTVTSFPTTVDVTLASLSALLSAYVTLPLKTGDYFKFYTVITLKDGSVNSAFDPINQFNSSIPNLPGSSIDLTYTVVCPLNLSDFVGNYTMDDGSPSDLCVITVSLDPANPNGLIFNNFYGGTGVGVISPIKIKVDRATYGISLNPSPQVFATYLWSPAWKNGTLANLSGTLDACTKNFTFKADLTVSAGTFGTMSYVCTRN